ncbi:MAG: AAA family ATPase [Rhodospirillales bacterium]
MFGRRTKQGKVFYLPAEDVHGMRSRVTALGMKHGDTAGFFVLDGASDLYGPDGQAAELGRLVRYERPALVVIDTLAAAFPGLEENASEVDGCRSAGGRGI